MQDKTTTQYVKGEASGSTILNCYICRKDGHYENQCPTKDKGKAPTVNMVSPEIQQVTTRSKTKQSKWEIQEAVRKAAKKWVEEANKNNASRMLQEMEEQNVQKSGTQINPVIESEVDATWQVLADCKISLPLARLL